MIKWTDIDNEVEEFQSGYRSGFVSIFKKYEGMETDERDGANRVMKVSMASFAERYGIGRTTFQRWVQQEMEPGPGPDRSGQNSVLGKIRAAEELAAAKATTQAEAKAATQMAEALARQAKEAELAQRQALLDAQNKASRELKAQQEAIRKEEQAKATAAYNKEIATLKAEMAKAAKAAEFDVSTMTDAQKQKVMTMLANDPDQAKDWFKAQTAERARKLAEAEQVAKDKAAKSKAQMEERESRKAAERARQDYEGSVLKDFVVLARTVKDLRAKLLDKPITFDHILTSGRSAAEWVKMTELVEDVAVEVREAIFSVNAEQELSDL